jgi:signal transduction histidine kinase
MIQLRADDKGLLLELDFDPAMPKILFGDEIRVKQIITNILTNAVKYTQKGTITFSIQFSKTDDPDFITLDVSIRDTGIGIKPEDLKLLFEKFSRIEEKRNRHIEGTGLGMSITQRLLELMGSSLNVSSEYGKTKRSGNLFRTVLEHEEVEAGKVLHIGDNLIADYLMPKKCGMKSFLYRRV